VLAFNGEADLTYLAHHLEMRPIRQFVTGIDQYKLTRKKMDAIPTPLPPLELQHRFAAIVESVEQQKARQRAHLAELDTLFASLQSRAFSGDL
jgi:type I restriction enzyme S subunit